MIRQAREGEITWIAEIAASDLPHPLPAGISLHLRNEVVGIEAQGVVGAIPLLNGDTLQILPKIGRVNFLRLLFRAEGLQRDLEQEYADFVSYSVEDEATIDSIVARQLFISAAVILSRSPQQRRVRRRQVGAFAIGQMDASATAFNLAARRPEPVVYTFKARTVDTPENRVITEAINRAWPMLNEMERVGMRPIYEVWRRRFSPSYNVELDVEHVEQGFADGRYGGARDYYKRTLMLARIVLGNAGIGFSEATTVLGDAVLLNTPDIFERYLRNVISDAYSVGGYIVTKSGVGVTSLYTDGSFELQPDIVISKDGATILIADAKYKTPTAGDHYQLHTYLKANGIKRGILLAPLYEGSKVLVKEYATADKVVVREVFLPMEDLNTTEAFLRTLIERFS